MGTKILIVDDDKEIRNLISVYLENEGIQTKMAEDALQALKLLEVKNLTLLF
ncbi:CheY-like chemotaxis protein [Neobacillus niacini]|nr:CheY-like chemotaxis protein [Neobacillus niacini]